MVTLTTLLGAALAASSCPFANANIVDAGTVATVTVEAPLYDTRTGTDGGCGPAGCIGGFIRDGDLATFESRWSCRPELAPAGSMCSITYSLADLLSIKGLKIAMYRGDERSRTMDIYVDGVFTTSWTSSGTTTGFETVDLSVNGQTVEMRGVLGVSEWLSILEVEILVDDGVDYESVEAGTLGTVTTAAVWYDPRLSDASGCDPAGCTAALTRDGDLTDTSRWSCAPKLGGTCTIWYDLGAVHDLSELRLAMHKGDERTRSIDIYVDGVITTTWTSSGTTTGFETVDMGVPGQTIELRCILADSEWISILEIEIMVSSGTILATPAPESTPTPSATTQPVMAPTGELATVGLIPLANGGSFDSDFELHSVKDGDFSTSWTCTGDPRDEERTTISYECTLGLSMAYYRHIKQVKIALADGDERQVDMRISGVFNSEAAEEFVTSSGTTKGFEVYDFDYFTRYIRISGVFATEGQSISISEVEFVEEVRPDEVSVARFYDTYDSDEILWKDSTVEGFRWFSDSDEALDEKLLFIFSSFATVTAMELEFPVGDTYLFDLLVYSDSNDTGEPFAILTGLESANVEGWQSFDLSLDAGQIADQITLVMGGTGSRAPGFYLSNARIIGSAVANPTDTFYVGSTYITYWNSNKYPDFVAEGSGDQKAIMGAICGVKQASFDGVDCVGEDEASTGTVHLPMGSWFVNGNIFMKSGVSLEGRFSIDDSPYTTDINLEDGAAGNTSIGPIIVMDGISNAKIEDLWIRGQYDSEAGNASPAVAGLGSTCISITSSQNITCLDTWIESCDGDGWVVRDSSVVDIDAGDYDDEYLPWRIASNRGTGLVVDTCDDVWVRRHAVYDNGVAGIHITGSNNFFFEATIGGGATEGEGLVGSNDGQQPIEVIVESSSLVTFQDMKVRSTNDPVMMISGDSSGVSFNNCGFSNVDTGTCVIQTEDPATVTAADDELVLVDRCYVKV